MNLSNKIETATDNYLKILNLGQDDVLSSVQSGNPKDFFAALERHKVLTEGVMHGVKTLNDIVLRRAVDAANESRNSKTVSSKA